MKKFSLHVILVLSAFIVGLSFLTARVYGEVKFSDLSEENVYYDSVMELVNDGIISGYSDGTFKPDNNILICEALTIIEKVFGNPENLPEWSKWYELTETGYIYKTDWDLEYRLFFNDYFGAVTYDLGGHFVFASNNVELLNSEMFGYSNEFSNFSNLQLRGYAVDKSHHEMMTRAEFCDLIVWAKYNINNVPEYSKEKPITFSYVGYKDANERKILDSYVLGAFSKVPKWLLNYYKLSGGTVKVIENSKWDMINHSTSAAVYKHNYGNPTISLRSIDFGVVLHELGHFIWYSNNLSLSYDIFKKEVGGLEIVVLDDYCKTNEKEYFSEAFKAYFIYPMGLKKYCPDTYKLIDDLCKVLEEKYK